MLLLREIAATSPTLAESLRQCRLRAGLSKTAGAADLVLGNPKAWLGTAYHEVLEKIATCGCSAASVDGAAEQLWDAAIAAQHRRAAGHPLDRRFGSPASWPGYHLARASVLLRAREVAASARSAPRSGPEHPTAPRAEIREKRFSAFGGKLVGHPGVVRGEEIVDYKSGAIVEFDEATQAEVVKAAYVRQLRIYARLVKEDRGTWPLRGVLLPIAGPGVDVALEPAECERESADAVAMLDAYNAEVRAGGSADRFASPSPEACRWCSYKLLCPSFWRAASPAWSGQLDGAAVEGQIDGAPRPVYGGAALALTVDVAAGSEERRPVVLSPLNPAVHTAAASAVSGDRIRLVGLRTRPDGVLVATPRTVAAVVDKLPTVGCRTETSA